MKRERVPACGANFKRRRDVTGTSGARSDDDRAASEETKRFDDKDAESGPFLSLLGALSSESKRAAVAPRLDEESRHKADHVHQRTTGEDAAGGNGDVLRSSRAVGTQAPLPAATFCVGEPLRSDPRDAHLCRELLDEDVAALSSTSSGNGKVHYEKVNWEVARAVNGIEIRRAAPACGDPVEAQRPPPLAPTLEQYAVRPRLAQRWREVRQASSGDVEAKTSTTPDFEVKEQQALFAMLNSYHDVLHSAYPYEASTAERSPQRDAYILHIASHIARAADAVRRNNHAIKAAERGGKALQALPRDLGFVRPRVLLLVPFRSIALRVVLRLASVLQRETRADSIQGREKLIREFALQSGDAAEPSRRDEGRKGRKPADFTALFDGNCDDHFRLGIRVTQGSVKLYADFLDADIIVASPLAIATKVDETLRARGSGECDFLSSIEVVVVERCDIMQMQNWRHVETTFDNLNNMPEKQSDVDVTRVREWLLAGRGKHYRQTILLTSFLSTDVMSLFHRRCAPHAGRLRLKASCSSGVMTARVRQLFQRFACHTPGQDPDARFRHFTAKEWPRIRDGSATGQAVFIPSYFDFVRVRDFLKEQGQGANVAALSEYTKDSDMTRGRALFVQGRRKLLLYTERAHFYRRLRIQGIKDLLFYALPEHEQFYRELVDLLEVRSRGPGGTHAPVVAMFCKWDVLRLERIVGAERVKKMISGEGNSYLFA
ncbi:unnamed protein product [Pedinophyceae sp. YPF-701]|nr:unnamed protein product [Pedinophyceae sp. YPF-701]